MTTTRHNLYLEECPLHTEQPQWEAQAPSQVQAAFDRGARIIGFTELGAAHTDLRAQLTDMATASGYVMFYSDGDSALAYRADTTDAATRTVTTSTGGHYAAITFTWHLRTVTVFVTHWPTNKAANQAARDAMTASVIDEAKAAHAGSGIAFVMADANPTAPLSDATGQPRKDLEDAGLRLINDELNNYPAGLGVTLIMRHGGDLAVQAAALHIYDPLGSDHHPEKSTYSIADPA